MGFFLSWVGERLSDRYTSVLKNENDLVETEPESGYVTTENVCIFTNRDNVLGHWMGYNTVRQRNWEKLNTTFPE